MSIVTAAAIVGAAKALSSPATVLVEKISDFFDAEFEPRRMRNKAQAEADAKRIHANADAEIEEAKNRRQTSLELLKEGFLPIEESEDRIRRTFKRFVAEEVRKQVNMERIASIAVEELPEDAQPEKLDNDWLFNFFDKCRIISSEEMQNVWGNILVQEATKPGTISRQAVNIMCLMSMRDVNSFVKLLSFSITPMPHAIPVVFDTNHPIYMENGLTLDELAAMQSLGLVYLHTGMGGFTTACSNDDEEELLSRITYGCNTILLSKNDKKSIDVLDTGRVMLTRPGFELASICDFSQSVEGFLDYLEEQFKIKGYFVERQQ